MDRTRNDDDYVYWSDLLEMAVDNEIAATVRIDFSETAG
jgi:hypothetical protein